MEQLSSFAPERVQSWIATLVQARQQQVSLPAHTIYSLPLGDRQLYASQLLLVMQSGPVTADQQALLTLLLKAMDVTLPLAELSALAQQTAANELSLFLDLLARESLLPAFLVDALVLCRLSQPMNDAQNQIVNQLLALGEINEADSSCLAQVAGFILGLPRCSLPDNFRIESWRLSVWEAFFYRELTAEILKSGASHGLWLVNREIKTDFSWTLDGAKLKFGPQGKLTSDSYNSVYLNDCELQQPQIEFNSPVDLKRCRFTGQYPLSQKLTALKVTYNYANFNACSFQLRQARAIKATVATTFTDCVFTECGHPELVGGAIVSNDNTRLKNCQFSHCVGSVAGAIRTSQLTAEHCRFSDCQSAAYCFEDSDLSEAKVLHSLGGSAGAVLLSAARAGAFSECEFERNSVRIQSSGYQSFSARKCLFTDAFLQSPSTNIQTDDCRFVWHDLPVPQSGELNELTLQAESWWGEF